MKRILISIVTIVVLLATACKSSDSYTPQTGLKSGNYTGGGETKKVTVTGLAQIGKAGRQAAYDVAVEHAMRKAVEQVMGAFVSSETQVENGALLSDKIYSRTTGFVERYEVTADSVESGAEKVTMNAWVAITEIKNNLKALGLLQDRVGRPMCLVVFDETALGDGSKTDHAKTMLTKLMMDKEFQFVDEGQLKKVLAAKNLELSKLSGVSPSELAAVAVDAGAQIIFKGKVSSAEQDVASVMAGTGFKSVRTTVNCDVIYAADARILASDSAMKPGALIDLNSAQKKSIDEATQELAGKLLDRVLNQWDKMANQGFEYEVIVSGVTFGDAGAIQSGWKKNVEGVKAVFEKGFSAGTLTLLVRYTGQSAQLARGLLEPGKQPVQLDMVRYNSKSILLKKVQ